jgi:hypothetical protein
MPSPVSLAVSAAMYANQATERLGATLTRPQYFRLYTILLDFFDDVSLDENDGTDPLNTAVCESDSDDPTVLDTPKNKRVPYIMWTSRKKIKVTNIWA